MTGFTIDGFKPVWCTLGSFGFATMAWLFGPRDLVPAFQMDFNGLVMVRYPGWNYLIHGASWCLALQLLGLDLARRRSRRAVRPALADARGGLNRGREGPPSARAPVPPEWVDCLDRSPAAPTRERRRCPHADC